MKKILSALLVAVMMLAVMASCATTGTGPAETTSAVNTPVKLIFKVGDNVEYDLDVVINGDAPVVMDAVKTAIETKSVEIAVSDAGDKVTMVNTYKDCTLTIDGKDVAYYWNCTLNGEAKDKPDQTAIKENDEIVFIFTRGTMDANNKYAEAPYDPSTNEYYDPASTTAAE